MNRLMAQRDWLLFLLMFLLLTAGWWWPVAPWRDAPLCFFNAITSMPCPGCGLRRAFCAISRGEFAAAWQLNAASFILFPVFAHFGFERLCSAIGKPLKPAPEKLRTAIVGLILVVLLAQWAVKLYVLFFHLSKGEL